MQPIRRAVIDVGTNSVKLLVADLAGHEIRPVCEQSKQTRLGHGFYETHHLQAEAITATAKAAADFATVAREAQAVSIRVIATSAAWLAWIFSPSASRPCATARSAREPMSALREQANVPLGF